MRIIAWLAGIGTLLAGGIYMAVSRSEREWLGEPPDCSACRRCTWPDTFNAWDWGTS